MRTLRNTLLTLVLATLTLASLEAMKSPTNLASIYKHDWRYATLLNKVTQYKQNPAALINYLEFFSTLCKEQEDVFFLQMCLKELDITLLDIKSDDNRTTAHSAASCHNAKVLKLLLQTAGDQAYPLTCSQDNHGRTALHYAARIGNTATVKAILDAAGSNAHSLTSIQDTNGNSPLHDATFFGGPSTVIAIMATAPTTQAAHALINLKNNTNQTALNSDGVIVQQILTAYRIWDVGSKELSHFLHEYNNKTPLVNKGSRLFVMSKL